MVTSALNHYTILAQHHRQLHVLGHQRDPVPVQRAPVRVLQQLHRKDLRRLLQTLQALRRNAQLPVAVLHQNLSDEPGKGQLRDDRFGGPPQPGDLVQGRGFALLRCGILATAGAVVGGRRDVLRTLEGGVAAHP